MSLPNHIGAYGPELDIFDRAVEDPKGVRVYYDTEEHAASARFRFHQARSLQREQNKRIFERTDPRHGTSPYDVLICRLYPATEPDTGWWIYIERHGIAHDRVESLSELET